MAYFGFYKKIPLIPGLLWLNLSKRGFSFSIGRRGVTVTANRHGLKFTAGLPGTGMFISHYASKEDLPLRKSDEKPAEPSDEEAKMPAHLRINQLLEQSNGPKK